MQPQKLIDMHMHSIHSDGSDTTQQLLEQLFELNVEIMSFTDHDSVECYHDLNGLANDHGRKMTIIKGVELSFAYNETIKDMLGYGIDINSIKDFLDTRYSTETRINKQRTNLKRFKSICKSQGMKFDDSIDVSTGNKSEAFVVLYYEIIKYSDNITLFPFIADNTSFYWDYYANKKSDYYVSETNGLPDMEEVIGIIKMAGGKAFLAHPYAYSRDREKNNALIELAIKNNVDGIEIQHSSNREDDIAVLTQIALSNKLLRSGGSDFHGSVKPSIKLVYGFDNIRVQFDEITEWFGDVEKIEF